MNRIVKSIILSIFAFIGLMLLISAIYTVESGERAIVLTNGRVTDVVGDGMHFRAPFFQRIIKVNVKTLGATAPAVAGSRDMQTVHTSVAVNYHVDSEKLVELFSTIGLDVEKKIIDPRIQESVKSVVAKYSADQLLAQRESIKAEISTLLRNLTSPYYIIVEDIQITNFDFSDQYNQAIEAKQTAEQAALTAQNDLKRINIEAEQKISMAKAEAEAIRIQAQAIQAQGGDSYIKLKYIEKWNGVESLYKGGGITPFVNLK
jgi:regulator of protease activity HflC (stomatin/prohibitin superfamily)